MSWAKFVHILSRTKASLIPMTRSQTLTFLSQYFAFLHHEASNYGIHSCSKYMYIECSCRSLALLAHCQYFWFFLICTMYCNLIKKFIYFMFSLFWRQTDEIMWHEVPELVLRNIFCKLEAPDLCAASMTCRLWNSVASEDIIWKQLIRRLWKISSMLSS